MPTPKPHTATDGTVTWKVRFRAGQVSTSETFVLEKKAREFCKLVDAVGGARAKAMVNEVEQPDVMGHTLADVVDQWWAWKGARRPDGTPRHVRSGYTLTRYEQLIRLHIKPHLGSTPVNLVTDRDVQDWVDGLSDSLAPKTVVDAHAILHAVYKWANARGQGLAINDPCTETVLPEKRENVGKGLWPAEWQILQQAATDVSPDAADLLLFFVSSAWRWSESVALRSADVDDYGDGGLWVNMGRVLRRDGNTFSYVDDGKSGASLRRTKMSAEAAAMIRRRRGGLAPDDLIFTNPQGRKWAYAGFHSRFWTAGTLSTDGPRTRQRILQRALELGLDRAADVDMYMLRHTHATLMLLSGEPLPAVSKRMGHKDIRTTARVYGSLIGDVSDAALSGLDEVLNGSREVTGLRRAIEPAGS